MNKNILLINSSPGYKQPLNQLWEELEKSGCSFGQPGGQSNRYFSLKYFGPKIKGRASLLAFAALWPLLVVQAFFYLLAASWRFKIDAAVCYYFNEKLIITLPARLLKIKVIWLEFPNADYRKASWTVKWIYACLSRFCRIACFSGLTEIQLRNLGVGGKKIALINPGVRIGGDRYQDNLFRSLARSDNSTFRRKYFAIGTITDLDEKQKIEAIFSAVQESLSIVANLQLIIVGEGREKKNMMWTAKKMKIDNLVWFVGEQKETRKWLESFDVFMVSSASPKLYDFSAVLEAMAAGLPVIGPPHFGLEDLVSANKTGVLIEMDNCEMLSRQIVKLHQDKSLRSKLGQMGRARAESFNIEKTAEQFKALIG